MRRAKVRFNYSDYLLLPEDKRYEILDGELYMVAAPDTRHQRISRRLLVALVQHVEQNDLGEILDAPYDVVLSEEDVAQPDILFVRKQRLGFITEKNLQGAPDLVVEILSPATRSKDLVVKKKVYAKYGVGEYWLADPEAATLEVLVLSEDGYNSAGIYSGSEHLSSPLLPELDLPTAEIFG